MDFTLEKYTELLKSLINNGYNFIPVRDATETQNQPQKLVILRHDVDLHPERSETTARIEAELDIKGTYYFRIVPKSLDEEIIKRIDGLGHEIGYHYEELGLLSNQLSNKKPLNQSIELAFQGFIVNLNKLRNLTQIKTICMHGSPLSKWDSRLLWKFFSYKDLELEKEPYFDFNFENILYLTDTGRRWNGADVSIRDKAVLPKNRMESTNDLEKNTEDDPFHDWVIKPMKGSAMNMTQKAIDFQKSCHLIRSNDIIQAANSDELPNEILLTFHPQRWNDKRIPWAKELVWQNTKNIAKYFLNKLPRSRATSY